MTAQVTLFRILRFLAPSSGDTTPVEFEAFKTFSSDVDERMADEIYVLRQILEAIKKLNLNIDISALERAITKQKRGHDLNFGGA